MFPSNFLTDLARKYELSPEQEEVFLLWWGNDKDDREISEQLHVTAEAIRNRKTGIYKKFSIAGSGANKANKLRNWLDAEAKKQNVIFDIQPDSDDLESLVQDVKQKIAADVTERCGTMRVLDMTQPVDLDRIYTDVNIIKDVTGRRRIGYDEVMEVCTREHFDRFLVGTIKERVTGFAAVEEFQKLVVLGKPGAGKTTFMKYLAMSCLGNRFHGELVPIFVTLKAYAEERGQPSLENYILAEFAKRKVSQDVAKQLLDNGKALILLDGLDEVKKEDDRRVKQDIDQFSRDWLKNRFAITCRIAAREYLFDKFTEVEVADFDDRQIKTFVNNLFLAMDVSKAERMLERLNKAERMLERLKDNEPVKELAKSPLLLTLLCLVFGERNDFPPKRSELYKEGLEVLMKKWDAKRNIEREIVYKHLSPQNKEDMLGQIAFNTFVNGEYFFRQEDLQRQIKDYICNLPEASAEPVALRLDSEMVLKAIEHHHGLLVERARNIYSFSHLTFQEYFTAREIERERYFETLMQYIPNPQWKEVFLLTAEMLRRADDFVKMMKERIDGIWAHDEKLQAFLALLDKKTNSMKFTGKKAAIRAYYAYIAISERHEDNYCGTDDITDFDYYHLDLKYIYRPLERLTFMPQLMKLKEPESSFRDLALNIVSELKKEERKIETLINASTPKIKYSLKSALNLTQILDLGFDLSYKKIVSERLSKCIQKLTSHFPNSRQNSESFKAWWNKHGQVWMQEYHLALTEHRNIGHDWQFTQKQLKLLEQYYEANLLLVECMNRSYVSKQVREEIESTMLLPSKK